MASGKTLQSTIEISGVLSPSLQSAIKNAVDRLADMAEETLESADAATRLAAEMSAQEDILKNLKRAYAGYVASGEEGSDQAQDLANRIRTVSGELDDNRGALRNAENATNNLTDAQEEAGDSAERSSEGYTVLKAVIADLAEDAIEKAVEAFKELATEGDTALAMLEARTGATSKEMEGFEDVLYEVYNANYGDSLGDVQETLSTVIQMTDDLDNASLAKVTKSAISLKEVFGFDTAESLRAANSLMDQFGITSDEAFNLIVQGAQSGLDQNGDLLDTINEYSVQFKNAGYSADDMFNMLANGTSTGTWSVDKLGDAVKEFNIRMSDGTADEWLSELGLDVKDVVAQFEKGGPEAQKAIDSIMGALVECDDATLQYQAGVGLFGTMWEDLGAETVASLMSTEGAIDGASNAMEKMDEAAHDTLDSSLQQLGRTVEAEVVQPIVESLTPSIKNAVDLVNGKVGPAVDWLIDNLPYVGIALGTVGAIITAMNWGKVVSGVGKAVGAFKSFGSAFTAIPGPVLAVIAIIGVLAAAFAYMWKTNDDFRESMTGVFDQLLGTLSQLGGLIGDTLTQIMPILTELISTVLMTLGEILVALLPTLIQIVNEVLVVVIDVLSQLLPIILQVVMDVLPILLQLIQMLLPVVLQIIQTVLPILLQLVKAILPIVMQIVQAVLPILVQILNLLTPILDMIISLLTPILDLFMALLTPILNLISAAITPLIQILSTLINIVLKPIISVITAVANVITSILGKAIKAIQPIIQSLTTVFQGLINFITGIFSGNWSKAWNGIVSVFSGLWSGLVSIVKAPINGVIGLVNKAIGALNNISVTIPDWVPVVGGDTFGINIPTIPLLASGGFTDGVSIAGEEAMEAVISFDPAYRNKNIGIWEKAGQLLGVFNDQEQGAGLTSKAGELLTLDDFSLGSLSDGTSISIYYDFSGFTWSPQIQTGGEDSDDLMTQLRAHEAEFFDWLDEFIRMREVAQYA